MMVHIQFKEFAHVNPERRCADFFSPDKSNVIAEMVHQELCKLYSKIILAENRIAFETLYGFCTNVRTYVFEMRLYEFNFLL